MSDNRALLQELVEKGQKRGFLTYGEVSDRLAETDVDPAMVQRLTRRLQSAGVTLVNCARDAEGRSPRERKEKTGQETIQSYLDWIGTVSLLTREGEVELARQIEKGRNLIWEAYLDSKIKPKDLEESLQELETKVAEGEIRPQDAVIHDTFLELRRRLGDLAELQDRIAKDPLDLQARFDLALGLNGKGNKEGAVDELIEIVRRDREWNEDGARKQLLQFFEAWGFKDPASAYGRRKLSSVLFS